MKKGKPYSGDGFIQDKYFVSNDLYEYIRSLTDNIYEFIADSDNKEELRNKYHHLVSHVFASMMSEYAKKDRDAIDELSIPIYCRKIEQVFGREVKDDVLEKIEALEIEEHNRFQGLCREFRLTEDTFEKALAIESKYVLANWKNMMETGKCSFKLVNLMDGKNKVSKNKIQKTKLKDGSGYDTNISSLIKDAMDCFVPCPFKPEGVYKLVRKQRKIYLAAKRQMKKAEKKHGKNSSEYQVARQKKNRAQGVFINDYTALRAILFQQPVASKTYPRLFEYQAAYRPQLSGRLTEINGGFQGASQFSRNCSSPRTGKFTTTI